MMSTRSGFVHRIEERQRQMAERAEKEESLPVASSFVLIDRSDGGSVSSRSQSSASQRLIRYSSQVMLEDRGDGTGLDKSIENKLGEKRQW